MQILKEEVKNKIHEAAVKEFKEKGFKSASMRSIARNSGMTVGNLYRYFQNKEALFSAVVTPAYNMVLHLINEHNHPSIDDQLEEFLEFMANAIVDIFMKQRDALLILIDGSEGTPYENIKCKIVEMIENHNYDSIDYIFPLESEAFTRNNKGRSFISYIISNSFIEGLIKILKDSSEEEEIKYLIIILMRYCFNKLEVRFK